ncbi:hypothetical protein [Saccharopolyspora hattusasensis]|uniref:hypothetical protein n=1 Tax=Saccharopolyspora hattusasensis TaxID=1128679 RepID=UPI003D98C632
MATTHTEDIATGESSEKVDANEMSVFHAPPVALLDGRVLVIGDRRLSKDSFDELLLPLLFSQLRANFEIKKGGSGSNPDAPEARDPMGWLGHIAVELENCTWSTKKTTVTDYAPAEPGSSAWTYIQRNLLFGAGESEAGRGVARSLGKAEWSPSPVFYGSSLDGGQTGQPRTIRCRMVCCLRPGIDGRELALALLATQYTTAPAPDLDTPFAKGVNVRCASHWYRLNEDDFRDIKERLLNRLKQSGKLGLASPVAMRT